MATLKRTTMMLRRATSAPKLLRSLAAMVIMAMAFAAAVIVASSPTSAQEDPGLDQTISPDAAVVTGPAAIAIGHVDIGPRFEAGRWTLLVHDDSSDVPVWRSLDETVLQIGDASALTLPDDPTYAFLGKAPGEQVYVIPQTQDPDVVWVGWNTQDPEVMATIDRGATLSLLGVEGPGALTMFLQSGTLGEPEVLWRSSVTDPQPIWVDVNTHTHANWVFTEPGVYLVQVEIAADLVTGERVSDTRTLRFAVGSSTSVEEARIARPSGTVVAAAGESDAAQLEAAVEPDGSAGGSVLIVTAIVVALLLAAGVALVVMRGAAAKDKAERQRRRATLPADGVEGEGP